MHKKKEERGKTQWEENPPSKYNAKVEKRQLLRSCFLHPETISQESKLLLSESLGKYIIIVFGIWKILNICGPIMDLKE